MDTDTADIVISDNPPQGGQRALMMGMTLFRRGDQDRRIKQCLASRSIRVHGPESFLANIFEHTRAVCVGLSRPLVN